MEHRECEFVVSGTKLKSSDCIPKNTSLVLQLQPMDQTDKAYIVAQIYKFESVSTCIFFVCLISMHLELGRVKRAFFEMQQDTTRTYARRLSVLSNMMILGWLLGLTSFYLSLALTYGRFTILFCWPTICLMLIGAVYQC
jgi:hypothetical protein